MSTAVQRTYTNLDAAGWRERKPHTSLIMACYRVEQYLPAFLASLDAQTADKGGYELIFVIDGCPERSEDIVRSWSETTDYAVRIIVKENGGVATARNTGFDHARGSWMSSPDPDDRLASDYLASIEAARLDHPDEHLFIGRIRLLDPAGAPLRHPLDGKYRDEAVRLVDLTSHPDDIHTLGGSVFFDARRIAELGLRVHEGLSTASDADFIMRYLVATRARYVLVPDAEYFYQRRADDSSIVKTQERNIERFLTVFGVTHRALLDEAGTPCPRWLANTLLYFTSYLFRRNLQRDSPVYDTQPEVLRQVAADLRVNLQRIGVENIDRFSIVALPVEIRMAWTAAAIDMDDARRSREGARLETPVQILFSNRNGLRMALYAPLGADGTRVSVQGGEVVDRTVRSVEFLGEHWADQHVLFVRQRRSDHVRVGEFSGAGLLLGGEPLTEREIRARLHQDPPDEGEPERQPAQASSPVVRGARRLLRIARRASYSVPLRASRLPGLHRRVAGACVIDAYEHEETRLREVANRIHSTGIVPIWVLVDPTSNPARRLRDLFGHRVGRGTREHFALMKHAESLVSDRLDRATGAPFPADVLEVSWRAVYVAGPIAERDYRVLNPAHLDRVVVSSEHAQQLLVADRGDYRFTRSEVVMLRA